MSLTNFSIPAFVNPKSSVSEAYRTLRTNIQFANVDNVLRRLLFTSAGPGEGKSSTVANLGVTVAQAGRSVLIIDADMRKPNQHKIFKLVNGEGLSTTLVSDNPTLSHVTSTAQKGLDILVAGPIPPNPADLLGSKRMKQVLHDASLAYDLVLIDSPPTIAVTDSSILAQSVDGVILVLASGQVSREYAVKTKQQLEKVGAKIVGTVLNKVEFKGKEHYHYYHYLG